MRILITGVTGFIGRNLLSHLSDRFEIVALARSPKRVDVTASVSIVEMDLSQAIDMKLLPARIDTVIHLAQANVEFPVSANELFAVNTLATQRLLDYSRHAEARQFVLASTGDVYGRITGLANEAHTPAPASFYAVTKYAAELLVLSYSQHLRSCILRLFQPYGPGQSNRLIPKLAQRIGQGQPVQLRRDDRPLMTPIYIDDVTRAIELAIASSYSGMVNIAGDQVISIRELAEEIGQVLDCEPIFEQSNEAVSDVAGDNRLMKKVLGSWDMVPINDGLSRALKVEEAIS